MRNNSKHLISFFVMFALFAYLLSSSAHAEGEPYRPSKNTETRGENDCEGLPDEALTYYSGDYSFEALSALSAAADASDSYLAMQNNELFDALHSFMSESQTYYPVYTGFSRGSLAYYWNSTDAASGNNDYIGFYSGIPYYYVSASDKAFNMEREHIWPKSKASFYQTGGGADLHHLRPSVADINQMKSDYEFGNVKDVFPETAIPVVFKDVEYALVEQNSEIFECSDEIKGDVARILLYVYCRWEQPNLYSDVSAENLPVFDADDKADNGRRVIHDLDTLLNWMADDPVDEWEMQRNNLTAKVQGNRNVFIDYPEFAWLLFGKEIPDNLKTPSHSGCHHEYELISHTESDCLDHGTTEYKCKYCGEKRSYTAVLSGHTNTDNDNFCDVCEERLKHDPEFVRSELVKDGDHLLLYSPAAASVAGGSIEYGKVTLKSRLITEDTCLADFSDAVYYVEETEGGFYLLCGGKYLTYNNDATAFEFADEPGDYCRFDFETTDSGVWIKCVDSERYSSFSGGNENCYLEAFKGALTGYYLNKNNNIFVFVPYTFAEHVSYEPLPKSREDITVQCICELCGREFDVLVKGSGIPDGNENQGNGNNEGNIPGYNEENNGGNDEGNNSGNMDGNASGNDGEGNNETNNGNAGNNVSPKTGEDGTIYVILIIMLCSAVLMLKTGIYKKDSVV